jgi:hypothetical protein
MSDLAKQLAQGVAEEVAFRLLELAVAELPELVDTLGPLVHQAPSTPLVERLREILPVEGAAARARRALERG